LALLLALLLVAGIGEAVVRILFGAPLVERQPLMVIRANPYRGWEMMPSSPHTAYHHLVMVNALGLRGPEVGDKAPGERRILALGDSMVYGQGVADDETIPHYIQRRLATQAVGGESFTVVNGGLRGYSTNQELGLLTELGPRIKPDVVVLFWYWNDVLEHRLAEVNANLQRSGPVVFETKSLLRGWERLKWDLKQLSRRSALLMWLHDWTRGNDGPTASQIDAGLARLAGYLDELKAMSAAGPELAVVIVPDPNQLRGPHVSKTVDDRAEAICRSAGLRVLRLLDAARSADDGGLTLPVVPYDGHFNARANEAMAQAVADWLMKGWGR
jgi:lysophospholipase L1-like esterase